MEDGIIQKAKKILGGYRILKMNFGFSEKFDLINKFPCPFCQGYGQFIEYSTGGYEPVPMGIISCENKICRDGVVSKPEFILLIN